MTSEQTDSEELSTIRVGSRTCCNQSSRVRVGIVAQWLKVLLGMSIPHRMLTLTPSSDSVNSLVKQEMNPRIVGLLLAT